LTNGLLKSASGKKGFDAVLFSKEIICLEMSSPKRKLAFSAIGIKSKISNGEVSELLVEIQILDILV
jgi:hypothetical protein